MSDRKKGKDQWFIKEGVDSIIFVPYTKGGVLKKRIDKVLKRTKVRAEAVEKGGCMLKRRLQRSSIRRDKKCGEKDCAACATADRKGKRESRCREENVCYAVYCSECKEKGKRSVYYGETGRNVYCRSKEHMKKYEKKDEESVFWEHIEKEHGKERDEKVSYCEDWDYEVIGSFRGDSLMRRINEAVCIRREEKESLLNRQEEFGYYNMRTVGIT